MIRTRAIISNLSYDNLVSEKIIPDLNSIIPQYPTKRYPPFVYSTKDFSGFGLLIDYVVRAGLRITFPADLGIEPEGIDHPALPLYTSTRNFNDIIVSSAQLIGSNFSHADLQKYVPISVNMVKELVAKWNFFSHYLSGILKYNTEYSYSLFAGHPDIVTDHAVLDIKNTSSFSKMSKESCLQVLAYYALMKQSGIDVRYLGFVLPMQREIFICDATTWDYRNYLEVLSDGARRLSTSSPLIDSSIISQLLHSLKIQLEDQEKTIQSSLNNHQSVTIGSHIPKGSKILTTLKNYSLSNPNSPCQIFITNPRTGKRSQNTESQIIDASSFVKSSSLTVFVHTPYVINLCAPISEDNWQQNLLIEECRLSSLLSSRGTVVHCGAKLKQDEIISLNNMESRIRAALPYCSKECPLLLETPCKEGTEVCGDIFDLLSFFSRFNNDPRLAICIDTCHVFAAGYNPLEYIQLWITSSLVPIVLVHYNDSKGTCGSHLDRHAPPGQGHIGSLTMHNIASFCSSHNIPLIYE